MHQLDLHEANPLWTLIPDILLDSWFKGSASRVSFGPYPEDRMFEDDVVQNILLLAATAIDAGMY